MHVTISSCKCLPNEPFPGRGRGGREEERGERCVIRYGAYLSRYITRVCASYGNLFKMTKTRNFQLGLNKIVFEFLVG